MLVRILNEVIDLDQIVSWSVEPKELRLLFRNGASMKLEFRDQRERKDILEVFEPIRDKENAIIC